MRARSLLGRLLAHPTRPMRPRNQVGRLRLGVLEDRTVPTVNLLNNYTALGENGFAPPDTCGAAGTTSYVETINQDLAIYTSKTGNSPVVTRSFNDFLFTQGGLARASTVSSLSDPIVVWDDKVSRFIIGDQDVDIGQTTHNSTFDIAVSKSASPATLTAADWFFYRVSTTEANHDADYPGNFGYNADAFVFTMREFGFGGGATQTQVTAITIGDLVAGNPLVTSGAGQNVFQSDLAGIDYRPTVMHDAAPNDPMWLLHSTRGDGNANDDDDAGDGGGGGSDPGDPGDGDPNTIDVVRMSPVLSTAPGFTTTTLTVNPYFKAVVPLNPDGTSIIPGRGATFTGILKAAESNNSIVASDTTAVGTTEDDVRWYRIDVSDPDNPALADQGNVSAGNNTYLVYGAIDINAKGDIALTYQQSGNDTTTDFMSMYVTGRLASDPAGTMQTPVLVPAGTGTTNNTDGREGDLMGINVDSTPLTVTPAAAQAAVEGAPKAVPLGSFADLLGDFWAGGEFSTAGGLFGTAVAHISSLTAKGPWNVDVNWGDSSFDPTFSVSAQGSLGTRNHKYAEEGAYTVTVKVTDPGDGRSDTQTFQVNVSDPAVIPGNVDISAVEGADTGPVPVATFTDPGGPEAVTDYSAMIDWGDGSAKTTGDITVSGSTFTVSGHHKYTEESASDHPNSAPYFVTVTISHDAAPDAFAISSATVSDPAVTPTGGFAFTAVEGVLSAVQKVATFTDPGGAESVGDYSASVDWGDGSAPTVGTITVVGGVFTVTGQHKYEVGLGEPGDFGNTFCDATPPSYHKSITVTISHEKAPAAAAMSDATISLKPGSAHLTKLGSLIVVGTPGADTIVLNNVGGGTRSMTVQLGASVLGTFTVSSTGRIVVAAMGGNDSVQVAGGITVQSVQYGGPGNDRLKGGGGRNILIGCDGDDTLTAGNLGDLLVGGAGADRLVGGNGNDLLVSALLVDGSNTEDDGYTDLVNILNGGSIPAPLHVMDDHAVDKLTGGGGTDTFYYNFAGGGVLDVVTDNWETRIDI